MAGRYQISILLLLASIDLMAQETDYGAQLKGKSNGSEILLRWAPTAPVVWQYANTYGYTLERVTLMENGKILRNQKLEVLGVFKPAPLASWESAAENDDYVAVAAQSIYGEGFSVTETFSSDMVRAINQAREIENRFSFALFASDMSTEAAQLSGLFYRDEEVYNDFQYLYRLYPNIPGDLLPTDTATLLLGLDDEIELPIINDVDVQFGDLMVELSWGTIWNGYYGGYWVEKSRDGGPFQSITNVPIVHATNTETPRIFVYDSLAGNGQKYEYRVIGVDHFGEKGPPSVPVSGVGKPEFQGVPSIDRVIETKQGVRVEWDVPESLESLIRSFDLLRQNQSNKMNELISGEIMANQRTVIDSLPQSSNYYIIRATDKYGRSVNSFPYFFQLDDSIPPAPPGNFTGVIDTTGLVHLKWDQNSENDLFGYKVYVSNFTDSEFIQVPGPIITQSHFTDTINLETLNEKIYYQIRALDSRFNPSEPSKILELKKPDRIPPLSPVFTHIKADSAGIRLSWKGSPSGDVISYYLYRRSEAEEDWTFIERFDPTHSINEFLDGKVDGHLTYGYTFIAIDDDRLESRPAEPVTARALNIPQQIFTGVFSFIDVENKAVNLSWEASKKDVSSFQIYKSRNGESLSLFKVVEGSTYELKDQFDPSDEFVEYQLLATFKDGRKSGFSKKILVEL